MDKKLKVQTTGIQTCPRCNQGGIVWQPYGMKCAFCGYCEYFPRKKSKDSAESVKESVLKSLALFDGIAGLAREVCGCPKCNDKGEPCDKVGKVVKKIMKGEY